MAMNSSINIISLCVLFYLFIPIHAYLSPSTICTHTPHPHFCISMLPSNGFATIHDYTMFSLHHSLATTNNFLSSIDSYLPVSQQHFEPLETTENHYKELQTTVYGNTLHALEDCRFLANLNKDFLANIQQAIKVSKTLQNSQVEDLHTYLSAILTNHETCLDGLKAMYLDLDIKNALLPQLSNGIMSYSVSLALFLHDFGHYTIKSRGLRERKIFEFISSRKILQAYGDDNMKASQKVVVNPDGSGDFTTITDAVAAAPENADVSNGYFMIYVVGGVYEEYVTIDKSKKYIMMVGDGIDKTVITGNRNVIDGWTTFNSATFVVSGEGFVAINITFRNTAGSEKHQAVAVRNSADLTTFYKCSFEGYQDTLYTHSLRQFYRECDIYGTVDFIFGNAAVVIQNCNIYPRLPLQNQFNAITAQGRTDPNQNTGISIHNCVIRSALDLASSNNQTRTYLGRPWKVYSRTVYMQSFMDTLIHPVGWIEWDGEVGLKTLYYAEYNNNGPGSVTTNRVDREKWQGYHVTIDAADAAKFTVSSFIQGDYWLPDTSVPYTGGLV